MTERLEMLERCARSFILMGKLLVPAMMTSSSPPFHYDIERNMMDMTERQVACVAPRGHAKSSILACLYVLWHIFFEDMYWFLLGLTDDPRMTVKVVLLVSKTQDEAMDRLETIKQVLGHEGGYSEEFRRVMGNWGEDTAKQWTRRSIRLKNGTVVQALGTGQPFRGKKKKHQRPTLILGDDLEDEKNTLTDEAMNFNRKWLLQALVPALDVERGRCLIIGTPINFQCMVVKLFDSPGWRALWYKNKTEEDKSEWWSEEEGRFVEYDGVLWPEYYTRDRLLKRKADLLSDGKVSVFFREYECHPIGDEEQVFLPAYDRYWEGDLLFDRQGMPYLEVRGRGTSPVVELYAKPLLVPVLTFVAIDSASSVNESADHTAIINLAVDGDGRYYHLPYVHKRLLSGQVVDEAAANHKRIRPLRGIAETTQAQSYVIYYLWQDHRIRYMPDNPTTKKKGAGSRLEAVSHIAAQGRIYFQPWMTELRDQHHNYPRGADDLLDAEEKAIRVAGIARPWHSVDLEEEEGEEYMMRRRHYDHMTA